MRHRRNSPSLAGKAILLLGAVLSVGAGGLEAERESLEEIPVRPPDSIIEGLTARIEEGPFLDVRDPALEPIIAEVGRWTSPQIHSTEGAASAFAILDSSVETGRLVEIEGVLRQASQLSVAGRPTLEEWAVELTDGRIALVLKTGISSDPPVGSRVRLLGRYAGEVEARSRDGLTRSWPLVVGRTRPVAGTGGWIGLPVLVLLLGVIVIWFRRRAAAAGEPSTVVGRQRSGPTAVGTGAEAAGEPMSLPADPAEALEALAGRTGSNPRQPPAERS
jgi:hypothetical protein